MDAVAAIHDRNARVDADKAWETSKTRRGCIAVLTYIVALVYMHVLGVQGAYLHALIPAGGYVLSTLSLSFLKILWLQKIYRVKANV